MNSSTTRAFHDQHERRLLFWTAVGAGGAILVALITIWSAVWSVRANERIAQRAGQFEHPVLTVLIASRSPLTDRPTRVIIGVPPYADSSPVVGRLRLEVRNNGQRTLRDISLAIRIPVFLQHALFDVGEVQQKGLLFKDSIQVSSATIGNFNYRGYHLKQLNPGQGVQIAEPLFLRPTALEEPIDSARISVSLNYSLLIDIQASAEDVPASSHRVSLEIVRAANEPDLAVAIAAQLEFQRRQWRRESTLAAYFGALMKGNEDTILAITPALDTTRTPSGAMYSSPPNRADHFALVTYPVARWRYLLRP